MMHYDPQTCQLKDTGSFVRWSLIVGAGALLASFIGLFTDADQFYHSYLTAFVYWLTLGLGALFFVMLHHLTGAVWSVSIRRVSETIAAVLPVLALLFIPLLFGIHNLFHWSDLEAVAHDAILQHKAGYLNTGFFVTRAIFYFAVWLVLSQLLYRFSIRQDSDPQPNIVLKLRRISAPGMILFALTLTFAAFDWVMSLDAHWYSTIFGVYIFSGSFVMFLSFMIVLLKYFRKMDILTGTVTDEHFHDLGKLLFAFTVWWAYIAGSQYFLIWYGNIPEETVWFLHRWEGTWKHFSLFLIAFHFAVPFFALMFRASKRHTYILPSVAVLLLIMHYDDLYWLIAPNLHHHGPHFSWLDLTTLIGIGGIYLGLLIRQLGRHPLVTNGDPRLGDSVKFTNG